MNIWLYTDSLSQASDREDIQLNTTQLVDIFLFGQKFGMCTLRNNAIDVMIEGYENQIALRLHLSIPKIYKETMPGCPLRRVTVDMFACRSGDLGKHVGKKSQTLSDCPEFLIDLIKVLASKRDICSVPDKILNRCQFHEHAEGEATCT